MTYDYELVPQGGNFPVDALTSMTEFLAGLITYRYSEDMVVVFGGEMYREHQVPRLQRGEPDYLDGYVRLTPEGLTLGVVHDDVIRQQLHSFACWVNERWPARLEYFGKPVPLETLLPR